MFSVHCGALKFLKNKTSIKQIPEIFITKRFLGSSVIIYLFGFLPKPYLGSQFMGVLRRAMEGH